MPATLTSEGLLAQTAAEIFAEMGAELRVASDRPDLDVSTDSPVGRLLWPLAEREAALQLAISEILYVADPGSASGTTLDVVMALRGTERIAASASTVPLRLTGTPGTVLSGRLVAYADGSGSAADGSTWLVPDGTVIGAGSFVDVIAMATETGALQTVSFGAIWSIVSPLTGWTGVSPLGVSSPGEDAETDPEGRARLARVVSATVGTLPGVYRAVFEVPGVQASTLKIHENRTDAVSPVTGNPPHSLEVVCLGGADAVLAEEIFRSASDAAYFAGTTEVTFTLSEDDRQRMVRFSRPTEARLYAQIIVNTTGASTSLPSGAEATFRAGLVQWAEGLAVAEVATAASSETALGEIVPETAVSDITVLLSDDNGVYTVFADPGPRAYFRLSDEPSPASVLSSVAEPFTTAAGWQLNVSINGGPPQAIVFGTNIAVSASVIAFGDLAPLTGATASPTADGRILLTSAVTGSSSSINILGTSTPALLTALGLPAGFYQGLDSDITNYTVI